MNNDELDFEKDGDEDDEVDYDEHLETAIGHMDFYQDIIMIIKKDGNTIIIPSFDDKISKDQHDYMEKIFVINDPSFFLRFIMWIELLLKYLFLYLKDQIEKANQE
jgi:hypothetical protein